MIAAKSHENRMPSCVSITIPSYNSRETIFVCIESLMQQDLDIEREIIVVDSSPDDMIALICRSFPQVILIHSEMRLLPGAARNVGAATARGEVLAFIDSDTVADRTWLRHIVESMLSGYQIMGGAVANLNPHHRIATADFILTSNEFALGMPEREVSFLPGVNLACTRELFRAIGGFESNLSAGEDVVFTLAASQTTKLLFNPGAIVYHRYCEDLSSLLRKHYFYGINASKIRKQYALRGHSLARIPILSFAAPVMRFVNIVLRILHNNPGLLPNALRSLPWIVIGIYAWGCGFVAASFHVRPSSRALH